MTDQQISSYYDPLFNLMAQEHGLTLTISEMNEIISVVEEMQENNITKCDVDGCIQPPASGGIHWAETGYWSICSGHGQLARAGAAQPEMKKEAIDREEKRKLHPNGYLS
jgi:hypothetical protein